MIEIRELQPADDCMAVGRIYADSWKYAYKELLPKEYLDYLSAAQWADRLDRVDRYSLIAELDGNPIGTASYGESRDAEYAGQGEIYSIYLLPEYMGKGYGKRLIDAVIERLQACGYESIFLWTLEDNLGARSFYEKAGFICSGKSKEVEIGGKIVTEVQYAIISDYE